MKPAGEVWVPVDPQPEPIPVGSFSIRALQLRVDIVSHRREYRRKRKTEKGQNF